MKIHLLVIFFILNFGGLAVGAYLMAGETTGAWYASLNKAPWTPPGWVFGAAWFGIMTFFSIFMWLVTKDLPTDEAVKWYAIYGVQWLLNVMWNPIFFNWHLTIIGLAVILLLTFLIFWYTYTGFKKELILGLMVLPYAIWLSIASSLNAYVVFNN